MSTAIYLVTYIQNGRVTKQVEMMLNILIYISLLLLILVLNSASTDKKEIILKDGAIVHGHRTVIGHKKKAIYFVDGQGIRHAFPDFYTFTTLGFNVADVRKMDDERVDGMQLGKSRVCVWWGTFSYDES